MVGVSGFEPEALGPEPSAIPNFATPRSSNVQMLLYWYFAEMSSKNMPFSEVPRLQSRMRDRKGPVRMNSSSKTGQ